MPSVEIDYYSISLNKQSMDLLQSVHSMLSKQPLGTAMVIGDLAIYLMPHPQHKSGASDLSIVPKNYLTRGCAPSLAEMSYFVTDELTDADCTDLAERFNAHEFVVIQNWSTWLTTYYSDLSLFDEDDDTQYETVISGVESGQLFMNTFEVIFKRQIPFVQDGSQFAKSNFVMKDV